MKNKLVLTVVLLSLHSWNSASAQIELDEVTTMLQARRALISSASWQFEWEALKEKKDIFESIKFTEDGETNRRLMSNRFNQLAASNLSEFIRTNEKRSGFATADFASGRFRFEFTEVTNSVPEPGEQQAFAARHKITFDGNSYWHSAWTRAGTTVPPEEFDPNTMSAMTDGRPDGSVGTKPPEPLSRCFAAAGFSFRPGYLALPNVFAFGQSVLLSALLEELSQDVNRQFRILENDGKIIVSFLVPPGVDGEPDDRIEIVLSREQLGAVVEVRHIGGLGTTYETVLSNYRIRHTEIAPDIWFPSEILWGNWNNSMAFRVKITDAKSGVSTDSDTFQVAFQDDVHVDDHVTGVSYFVGHGPVDEDRAMRDYKRKFLGEFTPAHASRDWLVPGISLGAILLAGILIILMRRKRASAVGAVFLVLQTTWCSAGSIEWDAEDGWGIRQKSGGFTKVSQCGQRITALALHAFDAAFEPVSLYKSLKPAKNGISCQQISDALTAHGLEVRGRKNVSWRDLTRTLESGVFAIIAVPPQQRVTGHFLGAIRHSRSELQIFDPPYGNGKIRSNSDQSNFKMRNLVVLFVRQAKPVEVNVTIKSDVKITANPDHWHKKVSVKLPIANEGSRAVWVSKIVPPCGCARIVYQPYILPPGSQSKIELEINPIHWGAGDLKKEGCDRHAGLCIEQI